MVGNKVFLSITMLLVDLVAASAGTDLPDKGITFLGDAAGCCGRASNAGGLLGRQFFLIFRAERLIGLPLRFFGVGV